MSEMSVRGAGRSRGGATDTTMLIWKVIAANPGITRAEIWERVEHSIPEGYAIRMYSRERRSVGRSIQDVSCLDLAAARGFILTLVLINLRKREVVSWEGNRNDRRYSVARELRYQGNPDAVDETGTKAADHMAVAEALRRMERLLGAPYAVQKFGRKNVEAMALLVKALRAKGPTS